MRTFTSILKENIKVLSLPAYLFSSDLSAYGITEAVNRIEMFNGFYKDSTKTTAQCVNGLYNFYHNSWGTYIDKMNTALGD